MTPQILVATAAALYLAAALAGGVLSGAVTPLWAGFSSEVARMARTLDRSLQGRWRRWPLRAIRPLATALLLLGYVEIVAAASMAIFLLVSPLYVQCLAASLAGRPTPSGPLAQWHERLPERWRRRRRRCSSDR
jgi:hypothetical protein